jgi:hypothetical protein
MFFWRSRARRVQKEEEVTHITLRGWARLFTTVATELSVVIGSMDWNLVLIGPGYPSAKHLNIIRDLQV